MNDLLMGRWTLFMDIYNKTIHKNELGDFVSESSRVLSLFLMANLYVLKLSLFITLCLAMALYGISSDVAKRMLEITMS